MKFTQLGLIEPVVRAVTKAGHAGPTPIQVLSIPEALAGKDVLGTAETGTGKTAAFALPVLQRLHQSPCHKHPLSRRVRAVIITANKDLALRLGEKFSAYGKHLGLSHLILVDPEKSSIAAGPIRSVDILITTPQRLLDLHQQAGVDLREVEILVIDEADRMLDMGSLPDVQRIISQLPLQRQTLLFTATLPASISSLADTILRNPARIRIPPTRKAAELIQQSVCFIGRPQKTSLLVAWLSENNRTATRTLVFTRTRQGADRVVRQLISCGLRAEAIHGEKAPAVRLQSLARFKSATPPILVVTDLAARGIDVETIGQIINYDLPVEPETYIHRISRIVRAGAKGISVSFCDDSEKILLKGIERLLRNEIPVDLSTRPVDKLPRTLTVEEPVEVTPVRPLRKRREPTPVAPPKVEVAARKTSTPSPATRSRVRTVTTPVSSKGTPDAPRTEKSVSSRKTEVSSSRTKTQAAREVRKGMTAQPKEKAAGSTSSRRTSTKETAKKTTSSSRSLATRRRS